MTKKGSDLIFISRIKRDGSGIVPIRMNKVEIYKDDLFKINRLSMSEKTFIASGFNSFVVKLKNK